MGAHVPFLETLLLISWFRLFVVTTPGVTALVCTWQRSKYSNERSILLFGMDWIEDGEGQGLRKSVAPETTHTSMLTCPLTICKYV